MSSVFNLLHPKIQKILLQKKIELPTEPQNIAIPHIIKGGNVLLIAPTGLGKTEAALLPIFHQFLQQKEQLIKERKPGNGISILYITPLRSLNRDMLRRTVEWGKELEITISVRHGDTSQSERAKQARTPPDMLITTPETFQILFTGKRLKNFLKTIRWVIIDEIHEMANDERGAQLAVAFERLYDLTTKENHGFQRIGLSATVGTPEEVKRFLAGLNNDVFRNVTVLEVDVTKSLELSVELPELKTQDRVNANTYMMEPVSFASLRRCYELIDSHTSTLLFINTRDGAEILASRFHQWKSGYSIGVHHGSLSKIARIESEEDFKKGKIAALICTSSLELGIDVGLTDFVIQYNSPREVQRIIQRIGRSGHKVGKVSRGKIIATNPEDLAESIVIARRTLKAKIEPLHVRQNPISVLTNQIISIVLERRKITLKQMFKIIKRSYPFHSLPWEIFLQIVKQLVRQRNIWLEGEVVGTRRNSRTYFLENISMIPDEKSFTVIDISSRRKIGKLDESFILNYGFEGAKFILHGRPWIIVKRDEAEILVSQSKELGTIPTWIGEDIPVPFEVAQEVGRVRKIIDLGQSLEDYPCSTSTLHYLIEQIRNQKSQGFVVPDDTTITIESGEKTVIINACFGTKVNETLGRILSAILAQSIGESIGISTDAYRIILELPFRFKSEKIIEILQKIKPETLKYILQTILRNSTFIRWELVHVARKFGAMRKDFDYKTIGMKKLYTLFENTRIFDEALDKIIWERMDIERTKQIVQELQNGNIIIRKQGLSPIGLAGFETIRGLMVPKRADRSILMALKKRLEETDILLACTNCYHTWYSTVHRASSKLKCANCGAIKISVLRRYNKELVHLLSKKQRSAEENREVARLHKNASLVLTYKKLALMALMGRGIGPDTAARVLRRYNKTELDKSEELQMKFLRDILQAEVTYARTRGFWDK